MQCPEGYGSEWKTPSPFHKIYAQWLHWIMPNEYISKVTNKKKTNMKQGIETGWESQPIQNIPCKTLLNLRIHMMGGESSLNSWCWFCDQQISNWSTFKRLIFCDHWRTSFNEALSALPASCGCAFSSSNKNTAKKRIRLDGSLPAMS
jgi:hypothetical protein